MGVQDTSDILLIAVKCRFGQLLALRAYQSIYQFALQLLNTDR